MKGLTEKQAAVLAEVRRGCEETGASPPVREIMAAIGVTSTCTVQRHLEALVRKGFIEAGKAYGYRRYRLAREETLTYEALRLQHHRLCEAVRGVLSSNKIECPDCIRSLEEALPPRKGRPA